jgi:hypothetical protein
MKKLQSSPARHRRSLLIAGSTGALALAFLAGCGGSGGDDATSPPTTGGPTDPAPLAIKACEALQGMTVAAATIGLPTNGASITSATRAAEVAPYADSEGEHLLVTPARCLVQGQIASIDPAAPPIKFAINLPLTNWNRRALQSGGGGLGGSVITAPGAKASGRFDPMPVDAPYPITLGYVTFGSDGGHVGSDYQFTRSPEAMRNWGHEHLKKTRDVAIEVIKAAYSEAPQKVFFSGESAGGREAMIVAQKYPADYDGIIATSPVLSWNAIHLADNVLRDSLVNGFLDANAIKLVADRTRASCDALDGLRDGVIARYLDCSNDAAVLRCADGNPGASCLSDAQIAAVGALRDPYAIPVAMAHGVTRFPGFRTTGDEDGAPFQWSFYAIGTQAPSATLPQGRGNEAGRGGILNFATFWVRHAIAQDDTFNPYQFDALAYATRILDLSNMFDATDPNLSAFAAKGGKMILVHPSADNATPLSATAEYYRKVVATMGQADADKVMRLYVGPGGSHNVGGTTQVDALTILEDWASKGQTPPDAPIAYNKSVATGAFVRSMPACRYPGFPQYNGTGDPNQASSFTCTSRPDPME